MHRFLYLLICTILTSCIGPQMPGVGPQPKPRQVRVDWLGHECFLLTSSLGTSVLTNPYSDGTTSQILPPNLRPDIVLVTNEQQSSNNVDAISHTPSVFRGAMGIGSNSASGIHFRGVAIYKNPDKPLQNELTVAYVWRLDGMRFCFPGDVTRSLTPSEIQDIGGIDILFVPVGTPSGLSDAIRKTIVEQLRPRVVVPMGRATEFTPFATSLGKTYAIGGPSVLLAPEALPPEPTALIFDMP